MIQLFIAIFLFCFLAYYSQKSDLHLIAAIIVLAWTGGSLTGYGIIPDNTNDLILLALCLFNVMQKISHNSHLKLPFIYIYIGLVSVSFVSALINETELIRWVLFNRYFIEYYLFLIVFVNADLNKNDVTKINRLFIIILLAQVVVALIKWFVLSNPESFGNENLTGTYDISGGSAHLLITMIAFGFLIPAYFINPSKRYVFLMLYFVLFVLLGSKRAIIFVLPILALFFFVIMGRRYINIKKIAATLILIVTSIGLVTSVNKTLNPENQLGGSVLDFGYIGEYFLEYEMGAGYFGTDLSEGNALTEGYYTTGRISSTVMMFQSLLERDQLLLGIGTGEALKSGIVENRYRGTLNSMGIDGGVTGFSWMLLQIGLIGSMIYLYLIFKMFVSTLLLLRTNIESKTQYLYILGLLGVIFTFMFDYLAYSEAFLRAEYFYVLLFYLVFYVHFFDQKQCQIEVKA